MYILKARPTVLVSILYDDIPSKFDGNIVVSQCITLLGIIYKDIASNKINPRLRPHLHRYLQLHPQIDPH